MKIFLVRHGETDWNLQKKLQGREDIPLNESGMEQGRKCGVCLCAIPFARIYTSPLKRASETAECIAQACHEAQGGEFKVKIEEGLIERDFGSLSGMSYEKKNVFAEFSGDDDAETLPAVRERVVEAIKRCAEESLVFGAKDNDSILMVSHGAAITQALKYVGVEGTFALINTSINILEYRDGELSLIAWNISPDEDIKKFL